MSYPIQSNDDYLITYYKEENKVVITLPQTKETRTDTRMYPRYRRVDISQEELLLLLNVAILIFKR